MLQAFVDAGNDLPITYCNKVYCQDIEMCIVHRRCKSVDQNVVCLMGGPSSV
jgi:hypothetical protein